MIGWTKKQTQYLIDNYGSMTAKEIGDKLGFTRSKVKNKIYILGLRLSEEQRQSNCSRSLFKPGHVSSNKGKKMHEFMSAETMKKFKKNMFKKGHKPHNTKMDNMISLRKDKCDRPYLFIRISEGKWVHLHRFFWEKVNGPIPAGKIVRFKDGNQLNCAIENLVLMDKKDNMHLNSIMRYPEDIRSVMNLIGRVKKQITKLNNNGPEQN